MKKLTTIGLILSVIFLTGCGTNHNFMDVNNTNAKKDLQNLIGSGNMPKINTKNIIPDNLSGTINDAKGYANKYYEDTIEGYIDIAKKELSGTTQKLKGYYNEGVDKLNGVISEGVNQAISGELNKLKLK